jgi:serine/threonine-protein kinase
MRRDDALAPWMTTRDVPETPLPAVDPNGEGEALIGRVVAGNYRIERLIGSGAMGHVYRAEQISLGKRVAIKVLQAQFTHDERVVQRFRREAKSASRLDHPNSVQMIDTGQDADGTLYIAMELLDGRDLSQILRDEGALPLPRVRRIMAQVLSALEEAHAKGVVHRDLKPSNIMLLERRTEHDFVKVCDFGIAKAQLEEPGRDASMLTIQGNVCGTPEYMAPEQARGEPLDGRADLYGAAVILYQMVTGQIPFSATSPFAVVSLHLTEPPVPPSVRRPDLDIPPSLDNLILRALAKRREERPQTAAQFREELEAAIPLRPSAVLAARSSQELQRREARDSKTIAGMPGLSPSGQAPARAPEVRGVPVTATAPAAPSTPHATPASAPTTSPTIDAPTAARRGTGRTLAISAFVGASIVLGSYVAFRPSHAPAPSAPAAVIPAPEPSPPPAPPAPEPIPAVEPEPAPAPVVAKPAAPAHREPKRPHLGPSPGSRAGAREATTKPAAFVTPPPGVAAAPPPPPPEPVVKPVPPPAAASESPGGLVEAERLLAQGDVADACRRGEDARRATPSNAAAYKFLGKCYMRDGRFAQAKDNYRRYLELAPNAPDATFIKSMLK